jgi:hypothetical protein
MFNIFKNIKTILQIVSNIESKLKEIDYKKIENIVSEKNVTPPQTKCKYVDELDVKKDIKKIDEKLNEIVTITTNYSTNSTAAATTATTVTKPIKEIIFLEKPIIINETIDYNLTDNKIETNILTDKIEVSNFSIVAINNKKTFKDFSQTFDDTLDFIDDRIIVNNCEYTDDDFKNIISVLERVDLDYVLVIDSSNWLIRKINELDIYPLIEFLETENIDFINLAYVKNSISDVKFIRDNYFTSKKFYTFSRPSLWNRMVLIDMLSSYKNIQKIEKYYTNKLTYIANINKFIKAIWVDGLTYQGKIIKNYYDTIHTIK